MKINKCTLKDVTQLALLNKQLIDDEESNNPMSIGELEQRMADFLSSEYDAYFFCEQETVIGYALIKNTCNPLYLRQFLIDRNYRRKHYGTKAINALMQYLKINSIEIEVLPWNKRGILFWESCGFQEISKYMRLER